MIAFNLFEFDKNFSEGIVIGTDEAGRGPGAGGVFASAVYFPNPDDELIKNLSELNDSKKLSKKKRDELYEIILQNSINSTVCIEVEEIEKINILNASLKAMKLACGNVINEMQSRSGILARQLEPNISADGNKKSRLGFPAQQHESNILVLVDGNKLIKDFYPSPALRAPSPFAGEGATHVGTGLSAKEKQPFSCSATIHQRCIVKGDSKSASIAAASILAKVSRDRYMAELHEKFPQYNWAQNSGYLTKEHLSAIDKYGITPIHRKKFLRKHTEKCIEQLSLYQK